MAVSAASIARIMSAVRSARAAELGALRTQRLPSIELRIVERATNRFERQPELAADQDLLQPQQILIVVESIARSAARVGTSNPKRVVVMQRADREPREARDVCDLISASCRHARTLTG